MRKYKRGNSFTPCDNREYDIEQLLPYVDRGEYRLKASSTIDGKLLINICVGRGDYDYFYAARYDLNYKEFNEKYGKAYIDTFNFYL